MSVLIWTERPLRAVSMKNGYRAPKGRHLGEATKQPTNEASLVLLVPKPDRTVGSCTDVSWLSV